MSIFPNVNTTILNKVISQNELPLFKEYAWDFEKNEFILENGEHKILTGIDALEIWIYKALNTPRFKHLAYTWNYGHELDTLLNASLSKEAIYSNAERYITECLMINPYITAITDVKANFNGEDLTVEFTVNTIYREVIINV